MREAAPVGFSLAIHALSILLLAWVTIGRPIEPRLTRPIEVELIDQQMLDDSFEIPPEVAITPLTVPEQKVQDDAVAPAPPDGFTSADELFANRILSDPKNSQVKEMLPQLETTERLTQLCNLEGLEQLHLARPDELPDSISPAAFEPTSLGDMTLKADGAAFRAARKWYRFRFQYTVRRDFGAVEAYRYSIGQPIPESDWDAHDLIAEDEDE